ncbi:hypothetical protein JM18_005479 [Phytophthora kernoviae]|uniref:Uncharacterized protein n=2 Tax=Phytophthora kernoviae TaxID=325452 RepID=A0A8T0LWF7_9STRA|nr:hypothetical protein G195_006785 [Phytophthora kernoviae 00238/432]KAG2522496.1 hypothetical protein JM16_005805 [Phytophthora kernoviae]KAG2524206.1 hypothetical protein JM18_005479 [Phytophthora kernoviae]
MDASLMANEMALDSRHSPVLQLTVHEEEPTDGPEQFEFHKSFGFMTGRRLQRRYRGVYKKDSFMTQLMTWVIVAYVVVIFGILSADDSSATENASVSDGVFYFAIIAIGIYILVKVALIVRWIIYWIIFAELLTYAITSNFEDDKEALVLLHGYNCSLDYGMNRLAQLLALGDFPSYIHPFVFSWPSGGVLAYWPAKNTGSESERTAHDFIQFVKSLIDAGYTKLNIIGHSMGARIFFSCLQKGLFDEVFLPTGSNADIRTATRKLELSTLTFCNPDYEQNEFAKYGGSYDRARHFCSHITLYADNLDGALFYIEYLSMTSLKGPLNYSLGRRGHMMYRNKEDSVIVGQPDTQRRNWQEKNLSAPQDLNLAFAAVNESGNYPGVTSHAYNRNRTHPTTDESSPYGTAQSGDGEEEPLHYLDMDVIDTTWMDNNVHAIRHNYFNLNPTIVDDLRHLIVLKKRASSRPGLLKTTSAENVYIFLVAPSHVKNK